MASVCSPQVSPTRSRQKTIHTFHSLLCSFISYWWFIRGETSGATLDHTAGSLVGTSWGMMADGVDLLIPITRGAQLSVWCLQPVKQLGVNILMNVYWPVHSKHAIYQARTVAPFICSRYIIRDLACPDAPEQLYTWANARKAQKVESSACEHKWNLRVSQLSPL